MRLDRVSGRRLAVFALLVLASCLGVSLVAVRILRTETLEYRFLVWNLFLAWLPFLFAIVLYDAYRRGRGGAFLVGCGALWLLFLPNAPYILTDFVHLSEPGAAPLWYDGLTVAVFAFTGLMLGLGSLVLVQTVVAAARGPVAAWTTGLGVLALSSVGVYLGRFVGVNSWDAIVDPGRVLEPFADKLDESLVHPRFLVVTGTLTAFLALAYVLVYTVARPGLELDPRPRRR